MTPIQQLIDAYGRAAFRYQDNSNLANRDLFNAASAALLAAYDARMGEVVTAEMVDAASAAYRVAAGGNYTPYSWMMRAALTAAVSAVSAAPPAQDRPDAVALKEAFNAGIEWHKLMTTPDERPAPDRAEALAKALEEVDTIIWADPQVIECAGRARVLINAALAAHRARQAAFESGGEAEQRERDRKIGELIRLAGETAKKRLRESYGDDWQRVLLEAIGGPRPAQADRDRQEGER